MNRFKGWELVNSVPEELWTEVGNIVQEAANKPSKEEKKEKWLSEEASQIAKEEKQKARGKGEGVHD